MLEIHWSTVCFTVVNLLVLYAFLRHFLFGRVNQVLDERSKLVQDQLSQAADAQEQARKAKEQYEQRLAQAAAEAQRLEEDGRRRGQEAYEAQMEQARADAGKLARDTRSQLENERQAMLKGARHEVAALALLAAARVAGKSVNQGEDQALIDEILTREEARL